MGNCIPSQYVVFLKDSMYLFERESKQERARAQAGGGAEGEGEAD